MLAFEALICFSRSRRFSAFLRAPVFFLGIFHRLRLGAARQPLPAAPPAPGGGPRQREEAGSAPRPGPAPRRGTKVPLQPPLGPLGRLVGAVGAQPASGPRNAASLGLRLLGHTHMHTKSCCLHMGVRVLRTFPRYSGGFLLAGDVLGV